MPKVFARPPQILTPLENSAVGVDCVPQSKAWTTFDANEQTQRAGRRNEEAIIYR